MIHVRDQDFSQRSRDAFGEAFLTHTSTSPNQQLLASLDLARRQVDIEGFQMVRTSTTWRWCSATASAPTGSSAAGSRILDESDLVPGRVPGLRGQLLRRGQAGRAGRVERGVAADQFVLDPTRVTLYIGKTGMNGYDFREHVLMERFGIQINKTSINSVLLIFTIGVTWSSVQLPARRAPPGRRDDWTGSGP